MGSGGKEEGEVVKRRWMRWKGRLGDEEDTVRRWRRRWGDEKRIRVDEIVKERRKLGLVGWEKNNKRTFFFFFSSVNLSFNFYVPSQIKIH